MKQFAVILLSFLLLISCNSTQNAQPEEDGISYDMESMKIQLTEKNLIKEEEPQRDIRSLSDNIIETNIP